eukprot:CAMPEP_0119309426 /NCGR_PEP_ID=MMETSP1333-20130426/15534_1 /TAXON_ID=418940 /ORGANISM="Scyphosphaera apsteinii, Strain RCC1455" /LENGTH=94 /DNA_ID=CAMNT_0007313401 /DNA_START=785 /DNA_END=1069 /DNA_ORIENTATION=-
MRCNSLAAHGHVSIPELEVAIPLVLPRHVEIDECVDTAAQPSPTGLKLIEVSVGLKQATCAGQMHARARKGWVWNQIAHAADGLQEVDELRRPQ